MLEALKKSMTVGAPPMIISYSDVCEGVGLNKYWEREDGYRFANFETASGDKLATNGEKNYYGANGAAN